MSDPLQQTQEKMQQLITFLDTLELLLLSAMSRVSFVTAGSGTGIGGSGGPLASPLYGLPRCILVPPESLCRLHPATAGFSFSLSVFALHSPCLDMDLKHMYCL